MKSLIIAYSVESQHFPHNVEKYYKTPSGLKIFRDINSLLTSLVNTLIWRKNANFP